MVVVAGAGPQREAQEAQEQVVEPNEGNDELVQAIGSLMTQSMTPGKSVKSSSAPLFDGRS
jgi:hypothetical protein